MKGLEKHMAKIRAVMALFILITGLLFLVVDVWVIGPKPQAIKKLHGEINSIQEKLISAQITSRKLDEVEKLISKNLALSQQDTLAQGASLSFLGDLTQVFDLLGIDFLALDPKPVIKSRNFLESPYEMEIACNYEQFSKLVQKMEQSPRLITLTSFEIINNVESHFESREKSRPDYSKIKLTLSTMTLLKNI